MKKGSIDKSRYGWNEHVEQFVFSGNVHIPKGSFTIVLKKGNAYWYFNTSKGTSRLTHLCKAVEYDDGVSFRKAIEVLNQKFCAPKPEKQTLLGCIDKHIDDHRDEGNSNKDSARLTKKTTQDKISHLKRFRKYVVLNPITLKDVSSKKLRRYIEVYVDALKVSYSANTIRSHVTTLKQFFKRLERMVDDETINWVNYFDNDFVITNLRLTKPKKDVGKSIFTKEKYLSILNISSNLIETSWKAFATQEETTGFTRGRGRENVVQFVTYLQLVHGFRLSEIIRCYVSRDVKEEFYTGRGGVTYLKEYWNANDDFMGYNVVCDVKRKQGYVMVSDYIYDPVKLSDHIEYDLRTNEEAEIDYGYHIFDVMKLMFSNQKYLISMDRDEYYRHFKNSFMGEALKRVGITKPHQLRDFFINFNLHVLKRPITEVSAIARNSIAVIEMHYLHESEELAYERSQRIDLTDKHRQLNMKHDISENT